MDFRHFNTPICIAMGQGAVARLDGMLFDQYQYHTKLEDARALYSRGPTAKHWTEGNSNSARPKGNGRVSLRGLSGHWKQCDLMWSLAHGGPMHL